MTRRRVLIGLSALVVAGLIGGYFFYRTRNTNLAHLARVIAYLQNPEDSSVWVMQVGERCDNAPFIFPTNGFVGFLWGDSFRLGHRHQGIDLFGGGEAGQTPVIAAHTGYLTRLPAWKSSLIIRIPDDPLFPGRQIWMYYTHMASSNGESYIVDQFSPGTSEIYVPEGTLLGYQGNFSGDPYNPTGVHLHFSIVLSDNEGSFLNELEIANTLDPSPYFNLSLNNSLNREEVSGCLNPSVGVEASAAE